MLSNAPDILAASNLVVASIEAIEYGEAHLHHGEDPAKKKEEKDRHHKRSSEKKVGVRKATNTTLHEFRRGTLNQSQVLRLL
jgi:hypothetical protein